MSTRRSVLRGSLGLAAAGTLTRPFVTNAAATTATVWWAQGFAEEEDEAIKKVVAEYENASGNTIDLTITPFAPQRQKIVAAVQSGIVPDVFPNNPGRYMPGMTSSLTFPISWTHKGRSTLRPRCSRLLSRIIRRSSGVRHRLRRVRDRENLRRSTRSDAGTAEAMAECPRDGYRLQPDLGDRRSRLWHRASLSCWQHTSKRK